VSTCTGGRKRVNVTVPHVVCDIETGQRSKLGQNPDSCVLSISTLRSTSCGYHICFWPTESYADSWTLVRAAMFSLNISKVLSGVKADVLFALGNAAIAGRNFNVRSRFKVIPRAVVVEL
jgi:hypothetical protein